MFGGKENDTMPMTSPRYICDACGKDLTYKSNAVEYRLDLKAQGKASPRWGLLTAVIKYPPIKSDACFCDLECLKKWLEGR